MCHNTALAVRPFLPCAQRAAWFDQPALHQCTAQQRCPAARCVGVLRAGAASIVLSGCHGEPLTQRACTFPLCPLLPLSGCQPAVCSLRHFIHWRHPVVLLEEISSWEAQPTVYQARGSVRMQGAVHTGGGGDGGHLHMNAGLACVLPEATAFQHCCQGSTSPAAMPAG